MDQPVLPTSTKPARDGPARDGPARDGPARYVALTEECK